MPILEINDLIAVLGLVLTAFGIFGAIAWNVLRMIRHVQDELDKFKLTVAENYVGSEQIRALEHSIIRTEERTFGAISNLTDRIDRLLTRMDK